MGKRNISKQIFILTLALIIIVLFSISAAGSESLISATPLLNQVSLGQTASYSLKITNNAEVTQRYSLYSFQSGQGWSVDPSPLKDRVIEIQPGQSYTTKINILPLEDFSPGIYYVSLTVESDRGERHTQSMKIYLAPEKAVDYIPALKVIVDMDEKIDPTSNVPIKLFIENRNPLNLPELKVKIKSDMPEFVQEAVVNLPPLEKKTVEFTIQPSIFQQPKDYTLFFVFQRESEDVKVVEKRIEILTRTPEFTKEINSRMVFLKDFVSVKVTNQGNVKNTQEVKIPASIWKSLLSRGDVTSKKIDSERYLVSQVTLSPNQSIDLNYIVNYRLVLYVLTIIVALLLFYTIVQSPIGVEKKAVITKSDNEGAVSEIKVTLEVKNKSRRQLQNIHITDLVPAIANIEKSLELGTLRPTSIKHTKKGTKVVWSLAEVEGQEHRLITYKVRTKLNVLGTFSLPRATIEYSKGKNKKGRAYSNVFRLGNK